MSLTLKLESKTGRSVVTGENFLPPGSSAKQIKTGIRLVERAKGGMIETG
jgi:hypothetical protein